MAKSTFNLLNTYLTLIVCILISINIFGQNNDEKAVNLFEAKNYKAALPYFKDAYDKFPDNKNLSYFLGICLVETENYGNEVTRLLLNASKGDIPINVNFYLAKNYHALNEFELASAYYQTFKNNGKSKEIKEKKVRDLILMTSKRINPFEKRDFNNKDSQPINNQKDSIASNKKLNVTSEINTVSYPDSNVFSTSQENNENININTITNIDSISFPIPDALQDSIINFNISSDISYLNIKQFKTEKGKIHFIEGYRNFLTLSEKIIITEDLRKKYEITESFEERSKISTKVLELENEIYELKKATDLQYNKSRDAEIQYWMNKDLSEIQMLKKENDSILNIEIDRIRNIMKSEKEEFVTTENFVNIESIDNDTTNIISDILKNEEKISSNGIIYKIQIGAFKTELPPASKALFKKLSVLRKIDNYTDDKGVTYYTIGEVINFKDAVKLQDQIRKESVKDAFIIIFKDGKKLSYSEAKQYLK